MMNKQKTHKTVFVRNTEQTLPEAKISETLIKCEKKQDEPTSTKKTSKDASPNFDCPQKYSTGKISEKIKTLDKTKPRKSKSVSYIEKNQHLVLDEKITKQVNFPNDQPIYKDLISLCVKMQCQPMILSRDPLPMKDKEPVLCDFYSPKQIPEHTFPISSRATVKQQKCQYKGLKLYSATQNWCDK